MDRIARSFSIQNISEIQRDVRELFVTAYDIDPIWHVKMQAAFQKYVDNAVSKTVNLPFDAKVDDVKNIYLEAYKIGVKGITVYRYGSRKEQVIYFGRPGQIEAGKGKVTASSEFAGYCSSGTCSL